MTDIQMTTLVLIVFINFISAFLQASVGFGYAILAMSLMPLILPMRLASAISAVTIVAIGLQMVIILRKNFNWRNVVVPIICCILTTNLGVYILMHFPEKILRSILAAFLLLFTLYFIFLQKNKVEIKKSLKNDILFGLFTGISAGMFNISGPFFMVYFFSTSKDNLSYKANLELIFLVIGLYTTILHIIYGNIAIEEMPFILSSAVSAVAAGFIGLKLFRLINKEMIRKVIYFALPIMAFLLFK